MLKISTIDGNNRRRLVLEGELIGPWTSELRSACEVARIDLPPGGLLIDMKHVIAISQEGENLLLELMQAGVKFRCCGVFTKHVLKQIARRARGTCRERRDDGESHHNFEDRDKVNFRHNA
jgi:hypothetical protein